MKLLLLQGPNLNLLGERPGDVPGVTAASLEASVRDEALRTGFSEVRCVQSNHEGALVDALHDARTWAAGVVMNPGALTHTSWVLHDAVAAVRLPVVEVHLSNLDAREPWRKQTVLADVVTARIHGKGVDGYLEAVRRIAGEVAGAVVAQRGTSAAGVASAPVVATAPGGSGAKGGASESGLVSVPGAVTASGAATAPGAATAVENAGASAAGAAPSVGHPAVSAASDSWGVAKIPPAHGAAPGQSQSVTSSPELNNVAGAPAVAPTVGPRKTLGRRQAEPAPDARPSKTLGRKRPDPAPGEQLPPGGAAWPSGVPTRAQVADRLARHLSGSESASALAAFAREGWMRLDAGAEVPLSERPLLEEVLRRLMFLDRKAGAMDAQDLVELLARLQ